MPNLRAYVYKTNGEVLGYFLNPELENLSEGQFLIRGSLYGQDDTLLDRVQFNPQTLPHQVDTASVSGGGGRLFRSYVLRARQPVEMIGTQE